MFHDIPASIRQRMDELEKADVVDRTDGTPRLLRLRQVNPATTPLLAILAASAPGGRIVEVGASAGYSTMWLALAARAKGRHITTFEWDPRKAAMARDTFERTDLEDIVNLIEDDARDHLAALDGVGFCFIDAEKELYEDCFDLVVPNLVPGAILTADNTLNHRPTLGPLIDRAAADERLDTVDVPIGMGLLVVRRG